MEKLLEKLKSLDKKVLIGAGIGVAVVIILIVALIIGLGNNKPTGGNSGNSQNGTQNGLFGGNGTEDDTNHIAGSEGLGTEVLGTELETEMETEMGTEVDDTEKESETQTEGVGGTTVTKPDDVNGVEQNPVTTKPDGEEIFGLGSKDEPYLERPVDMKVETVQIPANTALYYSIYLYEEKYLMIDDPDAYVVYKNKTYKPSNGRVYFKVRKPLPGQPVDFQIGNSSSTPKAFTVKFVDPLGSWDNPDTVKSIVNQGTYEVSLAAGAETGYYYTYTVEKTGTLRFYVTGTAESSLEVQNSNAQATEAVTFAEEKFVKTDEQGRKYIEMKVTQGEKIKIHVCAVPQDNSYPATKITWEAKFV